MNMQTNSDITKLCLSEKTHAKLKLLAEEKHFLEMKDAYRFGIALAISHGIHPPEIAPPKSNGIFSISQIDPDHSIALAISLLMDMEDVSPYRWVERLAEWGVDELARESKNGQIDFVRLLAAAKEKAETL